MLRLPFSCNNQKMPTNYILLVGKPWRVMNNILLILERNISQNPAVPSRSWNQNVVVLGHCLFLKVPNFILRDTFLCSVFLPLSHCFFKLKLLCCRPWGKHLSTCRTLTMKILKSRYWLKLPLFHFVFKGKNLTTNMLLRILQGFTLAVCKCNYRKSVYVFLCQCIKVDTLLVMADHVLFRVLLWMWPGYSNTKKQCS